MNQLYEYCVDITKYIKVSKRYIGMGEYMSGGLIANIIKTLVLKKGYKNLDYVNDYVLKINNELNALCLEQELKHFKNSGNAAVLYDNTQIDGIIYKQLDKLYTYLDELQSEIEIIKEEIGNK